MFKYQYFRAKSIEEVCRTLKEYGEKGRIVAGGTDIMVQIREKDPRWREMECLIDISFLEKELRYIEEEQDHIRIGALATHTDLERSGVIRRHAAFLGEAAASVGSPQIRNRGTLGGSICNASPAADPLTPLVAMDAEAVIQGEKGERKVRLVNFYVGKGKIDLRADEFLKEFFVPKVPEKAVSRFGKLGRRKALAISRLNVSVVLEAEQGKIVFARIAPGCIFATPDRVRAAEDILIGKSPSEELFQAAGEAVSAEMIARTGVRWSTEYKKPAVEGIVAETLLKAAEKVVSCS